jgi:hypothetical protein
MWNWQEEPFVICVYLGKSLLACSAVPHALTPQNPSSTEDSWDRDSVGEVYRILVRDLGLVSVRQRLDSDKRIRCKLKRAYACSTDVLQRWEFGTARGHDNR